MPEASPTPGYLIDSNVLIDIITKDDEWYEWSVAALGTAARNSTR